MGLVDYETDDEVDRNGVPSLPIAMSGNMLSDRRLDPLLLDNECAWKRTPGEVNGSELTVGGVTRKVISMELALQNEIAYKSKMECVQKQTCNEVRQHPMTAAQDAKTIGIKRQAPLRDLSCSPPQAIQLYIEKAPQSEQIIPFCKECNLTCSGLLNLQMHYQGRKHKAKLEELEKQKNGVNIGSVPLMCSLCKVPCMNERNLQEHLAGKKHAACVQALEGKGLIRTPTLECTYWDRMELKK